MKHALSLAVVLLILLAACVPIGPEGGPGAPRTAEPGSQAVAGPAPEQAINASTATAAPPEPSATPLRPAEPAATASEVPSAQAGATAGVAQLGTPVATEAAGTPATAAVPAVTPTPERPAVADRDTAGLEIREERAFGPYVVRLWHDPKDELQFEDVATVSQVGEPQVVITSATAIADVSGQDLTGVGRPTLVIERYTGGAHCCFGTVAFELGITLTKVLDKAPSNCAGRFADLDMDGRQEFITCDDSFAYTYCPFAGSPMVQVVMQYRPGAGYKPAGPKFPKAYASDIEKHLALMQEGTAGQMGEWDNTNKCSVLPVVLDYLYSGQTGRAWEVFDHFYRGTDAEAFRAQIEQGIHDSPLYISA